MTKWIMVILISYGMPKAINQVGDFNTRNDCLVASNRLRESFKSQVGVGVVIATHCVEVSK